MKDILIMHSNIERSMYTLEDPEAEEYIENMLEHQQGYDLDQLLPPNGQQSVDAIEKAVPGRGRESNFLSIVRQTFLILVVFDTLLTFIIWFMYCQVLLFMCLKIYQRKM